MRICFDKVALKEGLLPRGFSRCFGPECCRIVSHLSAPFGISTKSRHGGLGSPGPPSSFSFWIPPGWLRVWSACQFSQSILRLPLLTLHQSSVRQAFSLVCLRGLPTSILLSQSFEADSPCLVLINLPYHPSMHLAIVHTENWQTCSSCVSNLVLIHSHALS